MNQPIITKLPITYADSIKFYHDGKSSQLTIFIEEQNLSIILDGVIKFILSDSNDPDIDDFLDFIDIQHEYRQVTLDDLKYFGCTSSELLSNMPMNILSIYGNVSFQVICRTVEIQSTLKNHC
jgi:hypothetical protein